MQQQRHQRPLLVKRISIKNATDKTYLVVYDLIEYEELNNEMGKNIWRLDPDAAMKLIQEYPGGVEAFIQRVFHASSLEEAVVKQIKTEEQRRRVIQLLQQQSKDREWNGGERKK